MKADLGPSAFICSAGQEGERRGKKGWGEGKEEGRGGRVGGEGVVLG